MQGGPCGRRASGAGPAVEKAGFLFGACLLPCVSGSSPIKWSPSWGSTHLTLQLQGWAEQSPSPPKRRYLKGSG